MKAKSFGIFSICSLTVALTGCVQNPPRATPSVSTTAPAAASSPSTISHSYELVVKDVSGSPLEGARIDFNIKDGAKQNCTTNSSGSCTFQATGMRDSSLTYVLSYKSSATYEVYKDGYYSSKGELSSSFGSKYGSSKETVVKDVSLKRPQDYLTADFNSSQKHKELRGKTLNFISLIRLQSILVDTDLVLGSVGIVDFRSKNYLCFKIDTTTSYNSLKLNKYDIAKRIFDDSIRKLLNPINENISDGRSFFGYDITAYGYTKDFSEKYATPEKIEYRFLIPQETVKKYKNKDISGQQLLDASFILINDERVELKLQ